MKNIILILLTTTILYSCMSKKHIVENKEIVTDTINEYNYRHEVSDTIVKKIVIGDDLPYLGNEMSNEVKRNIKSNNKTITIVNSVKSDNIPVVGEYSEGLIAYSVPKEMKVGHTYPVKVRISKDNNKTVLIVGDRKIPISDDIVNSNISVESISVSSLMSANILVDKDKFKIVELSTEFQNIEDKGYTEWRWDITPIKSGNNSLRINIKIRIKEDGKEYYKDIVVFDKRVGVKSNIGFNICNFIGSYWQWLLTVIIIPILKWLNDKGILGKKRDKDDNK